MASTGQSDFDFLRGRWRVRHRRLAKRLVDCRDWDEFDGTMISQPILAGQGNVDDNIIGHPAGTYRAAAVRAFDPRSGMWSIWWLDSRDPATLGTPVIGAFADSRGEFYADDVQEGRPARVRFLWTGIETPTPRWEQAFSVDAGATWEINWIMELRRDV